MKTTRALLAMFLLLASTAPARADFQYTETSQVTGGALIGMVKFASVFARGDEQEAGAAGAAAYHDNALHQGQSPAYRSPGWHCGNH